MLVSGVVNFKGGGVGKLKAARADRKAGRQAGRVGKRYAENLFVFVGVLAGGKIRGLAARGKGHSGILVCHQAAGSACRQDGLGGRVVVYGAGIVYAYVKGLAVYRYRL